MSKALLAVALIVLSLGSACNSKKRPAPRATAAPRPLPSCVFREPRCTPLPRREPKWQAGACDLYHESMMWIEPGWALPNGLYVGLHRYEAEESNPCQLQLAWNVCRDLIWGADVHYDEQLYIVKIRIHRQGRGGKPFEPCASIRRTPTAALGMPKAEFLKKNPDPRDVRTVQDPELGPLEIYTYDEIEYELDLVDGQHIVGAIVLI